MDTQLTYSHFNTIVNKVFLFFGSLILMGILLLMIRFGVISFSAEETENDYVFYMNYDVSSLGHSPENELIKLGYAIFTETNKLIGPDSNQKVSGNRLSCTNCHLNGGTTPYAAPLIGVINRFPQYRGREDKIGTIEERINGCLQRSLNGNTLNEKGKEMTALTSYLKYLNRYAPKDGKIKGQGFVSIDIPNRAIDLDHGKKVFTTHCVECHGANGQGQLNAGGLTYEYPPLWGEDSYNNGAGMNRVLTAAKFIKANMPHGVTYTTPILTDEEAFDVAGYINQHNRPIKPNLDQDFPNLLKKPVSSPYPPYADDFSVEQHQKGPYQPIIEFYMKKYNITKTK